MLKCTSRRPKLHFSTKYYPSSKLAHLAEWVWWHVHLSSIHFALTFVHVCVHVALKFPIVFNENITPTFTTLILWLLTHPVLFKAAAPISCDTFKSSQNNFVFNTTFRVSISVNKSWLQHFALHTLYNVGFYMNETLVEATIKTTCKDSASELHVWYISMGIAIFSYTLFEKSQWFLKYGWKLVNIKRR